MRGGFFGFEKGIFPMSKAKKPEKRIDEAMVDQIVEETKKQKNLKEQIYDRINIPLPVLDAFIVVCVIALAAILIFCRTK